MPNMSGLDFYRQAVIEHPHLKNRFVFLSAAPSPADIKYLKEQGLSLLMKPFKLEQLREAVHRITSTVYSANKTDAGDSQ
jgi:two-component SAPR family response regulator